jgi:tRNA threonylcarbamoyladenosine biosynthesis protein TsaB
MKILALEFSSDTRSAAVVETGFTGSAPVTGGKAPAAGPTVLSCVEETGAGATKAFSLIESALSQARGTRKEIERIAVGLGPGSYTGIRVAIALAQGWQLAQDVGLVGVCSAGALAARGHEEGWRGRLTTVIDAQRNEVYLASYELEEEGWRAVAPLRLASIDEVRSVAASGVRVAGPEAPRWCESGRVLFPQARHIGLMAAAGLGPVRGEDLEPIYLRPIAFVKASGPVLRFLPVGTGESRNRLQ